MQFDQYLEDDKDRWLTSYGPRRTVGSGEDATVEECDPSAAEFWGVYRYDVEGMASHLQDLPTKEEAETVAKMFAASVWAERRAAAEMTAKLAEDPLTAIKEASQLLMDSWQKESQSADGMLVGERYLVVDRLGRVYSTLPDKRYKLEMPRMNLVGCELMRKGVAEDVARHLDRQMRDVAPFAVRDFKDFGLERVAQAKESYDMAVAASGERNMASEQPLRNVETVKVTTGSGEFIVERATGEILSSDVYPDGDDAPYFAFLERSIARFDTVEYDAWCKQAGLALPGELNFLGIGYWLEAEKFLDEQTYEEPEQDYRDDLLEAFSTVVYRFPLDNAGQYTDMLGHLKEEDLAPHGKVVATANDRLLQISIANRHLEALEALKISAPKRFADHLNTQTRPASPTETLVLRIKDLTTRPFVEGGRAAEIDRILRDAANRLVEQSRGAALGFNGELLSPLTPYVELTGFALSDADGASIGTVSVHKPDVLFKDPEHGVAIYLPLQPGDKVAGLKAAADALR